MPDAIMINPMDKKAAERIIYVEPNDIYGHINGEPMTPDYTDFCISFDLIVEVASRMRANSATVDGGIQDVEGDNRERAEKASTTYRLSWTSNYNPNPNEKQAVNYVSFMKGEVESQTGQNYLSTYYTNLHYNDFKDKNIVEGLGVESVNVSFESYYTPTIKIRFVDVRGASLFGREEVLHVDEKLKEDSVWGCLFTFPYPKYRLQIKGFYGKAVTYQLCCTDFRAQYNSNTGNYEIDVTFLGYDFGLLADIPMGYLIAAPYCDYGGTKEFWNKNKAENPYWRMSDGGEVQTFADTMRKIETALETLKKWKGENSGDTSTGVSGSDVSDAMAAGAGDDEAKKQTLELADKLIGYAETLQKYANDYESIHSPNQKKYPKYDSVVIQTDDQLNNYYRASVTTAADFVSKNIGKLPEDAWSSLAKHKKDFETTFKNFELFDYKDKFGKSEDEITRIVQLNKCLSDGKKEFTTKRMPPEVNKNGVSAEMQGYTTSTDRFQNKNNNF